MTVMENIATSPSGRPLPVLSRRIRVPLTERGEFRPSAQPLPAKVFGFRPVTINFEHRTTLNVDSCSKLTLTSRWDLFEQSMAATQGGDRALRDGPFRPKGPAQPTTHTGDGSGSHLDPASSQQQAAMPTHSE